MESRQHRARIEQIRLDTLRVPPPGKAQRPFREAKGDRIAAEFDINSFGLPAVCRVDKTNWLVDGQHRVYAIQKCGYAQPTDTIECEVYEGLSIAEMARMFLGRNRSTPVTAFERFGVAVTAGYPTERAITTIVEGVGLKVGHPKTTGHVYSVGALRRVYDRYGGSVLERTLRVLRDAYDSRPAALGRPMLDGVGLVVGTYAALDDKVLVEALANEAHGVSGIQRRAEEYRERLGRPVPECVAAAVVDVYNRHAGKKRRLVKWWQAHVGGRLRPRGGLHPRTAPEEQARSGLAKRSAAGTRAADTNDEACGATAGPERPARTRGRAAPRLAARSPSAVRLFRFRSPRFPARWRLHVTALARGERHAGRPREQRAVLVRDWITAEEAAEALRDLGRRRWQRWRGRRVQQYEYDPTRGGGESHVFRTGTPH